MIAMATTTVVNVTMAPMLKRSAPLATYSDPNVLTTCKSDAANGDGTNVGFACNFVCTEVAKDASPILDNESVLIVLFFMLIFVAAMGMGHCFQ